MSNPLMLPTDVMKAHQSAQRDQMARLQEAAEGPWRRFKAMAATHQAAQEAFCNQISQALVRHQPVVGL